MVASTSASGISFPARQESRPTFDRAERLLAVDHRQMAEERELQGRNLARRRAGELRLEPDQQLGEILPEDVAFQDQHRDTRHLQHFFHLGSGVEGADRGWDRAGQRHAEHVREKFVAVGDDEADTVALGHADRDQRLRHLDGARQQFVVGPADALVVEVQHRSLARTVTRGDFADIAAKRQRPDAFLIGQRNSAHDRHAVGDLHLAGHAS